MSHFSLHLSSTHPLAAVAAAHCTGHHAPLIGGTACGVCWERAIRDDERVVVEFELDRDPEPEPADLIDEIAVQRACAGERLALTDAELAVAIRALRAAGWSKSAIVDQLGANERTVEREAAPIPRTQLRVQRRRSGVAA
jgi:hypothetical protein